VAAAKRALDSSKPDRIHKSVGNQKLALKSFSVYTLPQLHRRQVTEHTFSFSEL
jgi:hypothetical protein